MDSTENSAPKSKSANGAVTFTNGLSARLLRQNGTVVSASSLPESRDSETELVRDKDLADVLGYPSSSVRSPRIQRASERIAKLVSCILRCTQGRYEDWFYLTLLGCLMGLYSFGIDVSVQTANTFRLDSFMSTDDLASRAVIWLISTAVIAATAALLVSAYMPSSTGSGFPEIKAYMQGVEVENVFSPLTCFGKLVFLPITLCTLLPLGKEGPVTHVAVIFALFITKVFKDITAVEMVRHQGNELVAAACTMGAAVCYGAPVGGVLFSIEATRSYFAVRNYWRGLFAAVCGTLCYKALSQSYQGVDILPMFSVLYSSTLPFTFTFVMLAVVVGIMSGILGSGFVWMHSWLLRAVAYLNRKSPVCSLQSFFCAPTKNSEQKGKCVSSPLSVFRILHTLFVCAVIGLLMLPWGMSPYSPVMSHVNTRLQVRQLFSNQTWLGCTTQSVALECNASASSGSGGSCSSLKCSHDQVALQSWTDGGKWDIRVVLMLYCLYFFFGTMLCTTLTLPSGTLVPILRTGVAFGRLMGELFCSLFPDYCIANSVIPGCLACMFGAALPGAITHAFSISVIVFEMTGQVTHIIPVLISVMVSNALARHLQPSFYDSLIRAKNLKVLPKLRMSMISGGYSNVKARDIMQTNLLYLHNNTTLAKIREILRYLDPSNVVALVNEQREPIGLVQVSRLRRLLRDKIGHLAWKKHKIKSYLTDNVFRPLDHDSLSTALAVDTLDLEIGSGAPQTTTISAKPARSNRPTSKITTKLTAANKPTGDSSDSSTSSSSSPLSSESEEVDPVSSLRVDAYCTVHQSDSGMQGLARIARNKSILRSRTSSIKQARKHSRHKLDRLSTVCEDSVPVSTSTQTRSDSRPIPALHEAKEEQIATSTPFKERVAGGRSRFTVTSVDDEGSTRNQTASMGDKPMLSSVAPSEHIPKNFSKKLAGEELRQLQKQTSVVTDSSAADQNRSGIRIAPGFDSSSVYDSLISQSSSTNRVLNSLSSVMTGKRATLELNSSNCHGNSGVEKQRKTSTQLSMNDSDCRQRTASLSNINSLVQLTVDRTSTLLSAIRSVHKEENSSAENRLMIAWRRQRLSEAVTLNQVISVEAFPVTVNVDASLPHIHKMFAMLCVNKLYIVDQRHLAGYLSLRRFSEYITTGHLSESNSASSEHDNSNGNSNSGSCDGETSRDIPVCTGPVRSSSQDTLDDVDDSVYDTVYHTLPARRCHLDSTFM